MPALHHGGPVPLYQQLGAILRARIGSGEFPPDTRIPGKTALKQEYEVSQKTVERTLRMLREEGLIRWTPGLGYFVTEPGGRPQAHDSPRG